jgi:hypothetical protein
VGRQLYSRQPTLRRRRKRFFAKKSDFDEKTDDSQTFRSLQIPFFTYKLLAKFSF